MDEKKFAIKETERRRGKNAAQKIRLDQERFCGTVGLLQADCGTSGALRDCYERSYGAFDEVI